MLVGRRKPITRIYCSPVPHIALSRDFHAQVSEQDLDWLRAYVWTADVRVRPDGSEEVYACRWVTLPNGRRRKLYMHREIVRLPNGFLVDHDNGDTLDNRRPNLRLATYTQNRYNMNGFGSSQYMGVSRDGKGWRARITRTREDGSREYLFSGNYRSEEEAARAYDEAALRLFGEFARLNFPIKMEKVVAVDVPF